MAKLKKTQLMTLSLIATLLFLTPLLSSSLRSTYLYFIINVVIIALGAEAGLLSQITKNPNEGMKRSSNHIVILTSKPLGDVNQGQISHSDNEKRARAKSESEKIVVVNVKENKVKKCPSTPSIFFIGRDDDDDNDNNAEEVKEEEVDDVEEEVSEEEEEELFVKAEVFIGNFYKQLKMQREESWNKIHGFYQNPNYKY